MIKIEDLIPLLKEGWVAMDKYGSWVWYSQKPTKNVRGEMWEKKPDEVWIVLYPIFDIAPAEDWTQSLIKVKHNER